MTIHYPVVHPEYMLTNDVQDDLWPVQRPVLFPHLAKAPEIEGAESFVKYCDQAQARIFAPTTDMLRTSMILHWAVVSWVRNGKHLVRLEEGLLQALLRSKPPEVLDELPPLPWDSFYLALEDCGLTVWNTDTGAHEVEGVYVFRDCIEHGTKPAIGFLVTGHDKGFDGALYYIDERANLEAQLPRNDAIWHCYNYAGKPPFKPKWHDGDKHVDCAKLVGAIHVLLQMLACGKDVLESDSVDPLSTVKAKKRKGHIKKLRRRGRSERAYQVIRLSQEVRKTRKGSQDGPRGAYTAWRTISGHPRRFWSKTKPTDRPVLATEEREGVTYYCYRRYVLPFEARRGWDETNKTRHVRVRR